jgi:glutathione synthase/RimK-type ligase-like ATP-grasp enzyme
LSVPPRIAIATCREYPGLLDDDRPFHEALARQGVVAEPALWDGDVAWVDYDAVLLRSVWDYYQREAEFRAWLDRLDRDRVPLWNRTSLVRWNMDKRYLEDLEERGIATVPTLWFDRGADAEAVAVGVSTARWDEVVLKPTVSGGAWRTLRTRDVRGHREAVAEILGSSGLMAQPFVRQVVDDGEYSLVFFGGEYSHAVRKRGKPGDFRVQWTHGGTHVAWTPSPSVVEQARAVVAAAPAAGAYARVDGVLVDGRLVLMELEQIEPYLFFEQAPGAAERFAKVLRDRL